jgi:hypothetical protein
LGFRLEAGAMLHLCIDMQRLFVERRVAGPMDAAHFSGRP